MELRRKVAGDAYLSGARVLSSSPISVALVLDHASVTGGAAKVAFDSALGLKRAGHDRSCSPPPA